MSAQARNREPRTDNTMPLTNLERIRKELSPSRRKKIDARARVLIAEEKSLRELREAQRLTQASMAKALGIGQDGVSRIEKRSDLLLTTLRGYIEAMGGHLHLIVEFPNSEPVALSSFATIKPKSNRHQRATTHAS
jgi:DNA-binding XRE family transcriptional regulator